MVCLQDGAEVAPTSGLFGIVIIKRDIEDDSSWSVVGDLGEAVNVENTGCNRE